MTGAGVELGCTSHASNPPSKSSQTVAASQPPTLPGGALVSGLDVSEAPPLCVVSALDDVTDADVVECDAFDAGADVLSAGAVVGAVEVAAVVLLLEPDVADDEPGVVEAAPVDVVADEIGSTVVTLAEVVWTAVDTLDVDEFGGFTVDDNGAPTSLPPSLPQPATKLIIANPRPSSRFIARSLAERSRDINSSDSINDMQLAGASP